MLTRHESNQMISVALSSMILLSACGSAPRSAAVSVIPALFTDKVSGDPDDPAVWIHPTDPARSLIVGTNKVAAPNGALVVFNLEGKTVQTIGGLARPNNVDVEYGFPLAGRLADIAVATERHERRLRVFEFTGNDGKLEEVSSGGGIPVFEGQVGEQGAPMGIALYKRPRDGDVFAIVGRKTGPVEGYLWQYRLERDGAGKVRGTKVREFGKFSGSAEIEAIAVDDELGYVYYADESCCIRKYHADPDRPDASAELAQFGQTGFAGNREGIAIYARRNGTGYVLCTDQIKGNSQYRIFRREGVVGNLHDHSEVLKVVEAGADSTDGIETVAAGLGPRFPNGMLVAMNSAGKNFMILRWEDVATAGEPKLAVGR